MPGSPTKAQLRATAATEARAVKDRWKILAAEARTVWGKLHPEELAKVDGNFHVLAGLVQMRYQVSRQESDRQVSAFFSKHIPAPVAAAPAAIPVN
jgi:hypothetical protein